MGAQEQVKRARRYWIGFVAGACLAPALPLLERRFASLGYFFVVSTVVLVFATLPVIVARAKKEAVPAKRSDLIGYAVIFAVLLAVAGVGYAVMR